LKPAISVVYIELGTQHKRT